MFGGQDIYIQEKEEYVKLEVQWLYRPEDVEKKYVGKWEPKDSRDLFFYSFHRDEVSAESVKHDCVVHFIQENKQIPNLESILFSSCRMFMIMLRRSLGSSLLMALTCSKSVK